MEEIVDILESTQVMEMAAGASTLVPLSPEQVREVAGEDPDPKLATYIIEGGWSKSRRYYGPQVIQEISDQINDNTGDIVGYQGHITPEMRPYAFPDIQFRWVKSKVQAGGDKVKLLAKAYLLPGSKAREYAERGLKVPISISGEADQRPIKGGVEVRNYDLESIDMARPRKAGMGGRLVALTSEMESEGRKAVEPKDIAALSEDELRTHAPLLVKEIESKATESLKTRVTEMEGAQEDAEKNTDLIAKIRTALEIDESADVLDVIGKTLTELKAQGIKAREGILDTILTKRFKDEKQRKLVRRVLATEMENIEIPDGSDDAAKVKITEMVNKAIDEDEDLKELATEMEDGGGANSDGGGHEGQSRREGTQRELKPGYSNDRITVRKAV
jgi:hypothetical protein